MVHSWCFCSDLVWEWNSSGSLCRWRPLHSVSSAPVLRSGQNMCTASAAAYQRGCHVDMFHVTLRRPFFNKSPECVQRPALNNTLTLPECFPPNVHYFSLADSPLLPSSSSSSSISTLTPSPSRHAIHPHPRPHTMPSAHALALTPHRPPMPLPSYHTVRPRPRPHAMPSAHAFTSPTPVLPTFSSH